MTHQKGYRLKLLRLQFKRINYVYLFNLSSSYRELSLNSSLIKRPGIKFHDATNTKSLRVCCQPIMAITLTERKIEFLHKVGHLLLYQAKIQNFNYRCKNKLNVISIALFSRASIEEL